jgi:molybdopterin molybdotransferase
MYEYIAEPVFGKSGMISSLTKADGYIIIDMNKEGLKKDEPVFVHLF